MAPVNGIHDMGGMTTFGPVPVEDTSPFHAEWEKRFATLMWEVPDGVFNTDTFRDAIERLDPAVYLSATYYERWLGALERLLVEKGLISPEEMSARLDGWKPQPGVSASGQDGGISAHGAYRGSDEVRTQRVPGAAGAEPRYRPGDHVRVRNVQPPGHTRIPRYVRGKRGRIDRLLSAQALPDDLVRGRGVRQRPVYAVRFTARELWGEGASPRDSVVIDLWEDYLAPLAVSHEL